jgi:hypothetical protein
LKGVDVSAATGKAIFRHGRDHDFTEEEFFALQDKAMDAYDRGDIKEFLRITDILPANPNVAKAFKEVYGKEVILSSGRDLTEANLKWGEGWLNEPNPI